MNDSLPKDEMQKKSGNTRGRSQLAYDLIRKRISEGTLSPGDHLNETELAQSL